MRDRGGSWSSLLRRRLDAPIERVWSFWTDPARLALWLGQTTGDLQVGGTVTIDFGMPRKTVARILTCDPPHRLRTTWQYGDWRPSEAELRLQPADRGTLLEIEHFDAPTPDDARGTGAGWEVGILQLDHAMQDRPKPGEAIHPTAEAAWAAVQPTGV